MRTRRILAGACALALLVPAAAAAQPIHDQPAQTGQWRSTGVVYGDARYEAQNARDLGTPASYADQVSALPPEQLAAAYGTPKIDAKPAVASPRAATVTSDDGTNGWRIAAVIEAAVLAACAVAAAVLLTGRQRRAPRMGH